MKIYTVTHKSTKHVRYLIDLEKINEERLNKFILDFIDDRILKTFSKKDKLRWILKKITCDIFRIMSQQDSVNDIVLNLNSIENYIKVDGSEGITLDYIKVLRYYMDDCKIKITE